MNPRERILAMGLVAIIILVGGGFLVRLFLLGPLWDRQGQIRALTEEVEKKKERIAQVKAARTKLDRWRQLSLPPDSDLARREYEKYLGDQLRKAGFAAGTFTLTPKPPETKSSAPTIPGKGPIYNKLEFTVQGYAPLDGIVQLLEGIYKTPLMHQVKKIALQRSALPGPQQKPGDLDMNLTLEGIIVAGAPTRQSLLPLQSQTAAARLDVLSALARGPTGLAVALTHPAGPTGPAKLAQPPRNYASIGAKNVFMGPPPREPPPEEPRGPDMELTRHVYLTDITHNDRRSEAFLYDRFNNRRTRLRASSGFDKFRIADDEDETVVTGRVLRVLDRDVLLQIDDDFYLLHVGQPIGDAIRKPLATRKDLEKWFGAIAHPGAW